MALREPLTKTLDNDDFGEYLQRALTDGATAADSRFGRWRIEVVQGFTLGSGEEHKGVSLWVERGSGRTESWQKVTANMYGGSWAEVLTQIGEALDAKHAEIYP